MKPTQEMLEDHNIFIVPVGFQPMGTYQYQFTDTVSNVNAVRVGKSIFCTQIWLDNVKKQSTKDVI